MEINDGLGMLLFFSIFEIIGGAALGASLRKLVQRDLSGCFLLVWGAGFSGIPLVIGAGVLLSSGQPVYFAAQVSIWLLAVLTLLFLPLELMQSDGASNGSEAAAIVGGAFFIIGGAMMLVSLRAGSLVPVFIGGIFAFIGACLLIGTAIRVLRTL